MILFGCVVAANGGDDNDIMFGVPSLLVRIKFSVFFAKEKNGWLMMLLLFCVGVLHLDKNFRVFGCLVACATVQ